MKRKALMPIILAAVAVIAAARSAPTGTDQPTPRQTKLQNAPAKNDKANAAAGKPGAAKGEAELILPEKVLVTVIEEAQIPAKVEGVLAAVLAREGQLIEAGAIIARIEDIEVRLTHERARIELDIARKLSQNIVKIQIARKAADVARSELSRALESQKKEKRSVSDAELDKLRLSADKAELEIEQAVFEQETAQLTSRQKETELALAQHAVDRRAIVSPVSGMVVEVHLHPGEWVQAGRPVMRVLRVDRLRIEGFVDAAKLTGDLVGRRAVLSVDLPGKPDTVFEGNVVFISPEVNPVKQDVRIWAEVDNKDLLLRPGMRGKLTIHSETAQTAKREQP